MKEGVLILCGGESSRMGEKKELLKVAKGTFLSILIDRFKTCPELLLSVREDENHSGFGVDVVTDIYRNCGPLGGIHAALAACKSDALLVLPCDVPLFSLELAEYMFLQHDGRHDVTVPVTRDSRMHPLCGVYGKHVLPVVEECLKAKRLRVRDLLTRLDTKVVPLSNTRFDDTLLTNVNTPEDYAAFCQIMEMNV